MGQAAISGFGAGDLDGVLEVLGRSMTTDPISRLRFARQVLLDPNFRSEGAVVARREGAVAGFCLSIVRQVPLENALSDAERGYITLVGVEPAHQRQGIGRAMLARAEEYLKSQGRKVVMVSSYAPGYFIPGVDVKAYAGALGFFANAGYAEVYRPLAMQVDLWDFEIPEWVREKERQLAGQRVVVQTWTAELALGLIEFAQREFPGDWVRVVRETSQKILAGDSPNRLMAVVEHGKVVAFSHHDSERFGPIGVAASQRGRCLGQILMYRTLEAQRAAGFRCAWFLWSDDATAARIYDGAGFRQTRRFALMRKDLT